MPSRMRARPNSKVCSGADAAWYGSPAAAPTRAATGWRRSYDRTGRVAAITVSPGRIAAPVHGTADEPYQTVVPVERLIDRE